MNYAWDDAKAAANLEKHGVAFSAVAEFDWDAAQIHTDLRFDYGEPRFRAFAPIGHRLYLMVYTPRGEVIRVISRRMTAKGRSMKRLRKNTPEEEARIAAGIAADPDAYEATDAELATMRPAAEVASDIVERYRRTRGTQQAPTKVRVTLHVDRDVVTALRESGKGWQSRANAMLRKAVLKRTQ